MKKFVIFLGSIHFAILLIALTAGFVVVGTFLEAYSDSHLYSAYYTYQSPFFLALIWGFFLNILISALRRWPFQVKHIPFLTTHLGLLMLLGGVIVKGYFGVQGSMSLIEGGSSNRLFLPNTHALHFEKRDPHDPSRKIQIDYPFDQLVKQKIAFDGIEVRLVDYGQHSFERRQTWTKDNYVVISGHRPVPLTESSQAYFHVKHISPWQILAYSTSEVSEKAKEIYLKHLNLRISKTETGEMLSLVSLAEALDHPVDKMQFALEWTYSDLKGLENANLWIEQDGEKMKIALSGPDSLINQNLSSPHKGKLPWTIDLFREPLLLFVHDDQEDDHLFFFNPHGEIKSTIFKNDQLQSLLVYDDGFGGYAVQTPFPFDGFSCCRNDKEQAELFRLAVQLRSNLHQASHLSSPLHFLKSNLENKDEDFVATLLNFLKKWDQSSQLLIDGSSEKFSLDWGKAPLEHRSVCGWLCLLLEELEVQMKQGKSFSEVLQARGWPFAHQFAELERQSTDQAMTLFAQQLLAVGKQLPPPPVGPEEIPIKALSAYFKAFGITLNTIREPIENEATVRFYHAANLFHHKVKRILDDQPTKVLAQMIHAMSDDSKLLNEIKKAYVSFQYQIKRSEINHSPTKEEIESALTQYEPLEEIALSAHEMDQLEEILNLQDLYIETPLTLIQKKIPPLKKWEDNYPLITLEIKQGSKKDYITLTYDKYGSGLAWPILNGEFLVRFQPLFIEIPYKLRLHDARQVNYPGTQQPYSYESDIIATNLKDKTCCEKTISMNNVYETSDGYRFYLASLSPPSEVTSQRVQIVVNYDPAKYSLTYPGALMMSLGIALLFWMRPYKPH